MSLTKPLIRNLLISHQRPRHKNFVRYKSKKKHEFVPPEPPRASFGLIGVIVTVVSGLLIGAQISKTIANFLEENELFVPSDDDDDDD